MAIVFIILLIVAYPLFKTIVKSANSSAAKTVDNVGKGLANSTNALPSMGAAFSAAQIADSLQELPALKASVGCNDDNIKTVIQLQDWMEKNNMM